MHMQYFERKPDAEDTRRFSALPEEGEPGGGLFSHSGDDRFDDDYDDGFDALYEDDPDAAEALPEEEEDPELRREARLRKFRIAAGIGDLGAVLTGAAVILVLVAFLISMLRFVSSDFARTFSLWKTQLPGQ